MKYQIRKQAAARTAGRLHRKMERERKEREWKGKRRRERETRVWYHEEPEEVHKKLDGRIIVILCVAVCCSVLQCTTMCCSVSCSVLQCVAGCRSVLQCAAERDQSKGPEKPEELDKELNACIFVIQQPLHDQDHLTSSLHQSAMSRTSIIYQ